MTATRLGDSQRSYELFAAVAQRVKSFPEDGRIALIAENNMALAMLSVGDYLRAEPHFLKLLKALRQNNPESKMVANILQNLAIVADARGAFFQEEAYRLEALRIFEKIEPDSLNMARIKKGLGLFYMKRGDDQLAEDYFLEALEIAKNKQPKGYTYTIILNELARLAWKKQRFYTARDRAENVIKLYKEMKVSGPTLAKSLIFLAMVHMKTENPTVAEPILNEALQLGEQYPGLGPDMVASLQLLGELAQQAKDFARVTELREKALSLMNEDGNETWRAANNFYFWAGLSRRTGRLQEARQYYQQALEAVKNQIQVMDSSPLVEAMYQGEFKDIYLDYIDLLMESGQVKPALLVLEEMRAYASRRMMVERDLNYFEDIPKDLKEERRELHKNLDANLETLRNEKDPKKVETLRQQRRRSQQDWQILDQRIRKASPTYAKFQSSDLSEEIFKTAPDTAVLNFTVGEAQTHLFLVSNGQVLGHTLPITKKTLAAKVRDLRAHLSSYQSQWAQRRMDELCRELFEELLGPIMPRLKSVQRLVIIPDGPLHYLPFGILRDPSSTGSGYLISWKPLSYATSLHLAHLR